MCSIQSSVSVEDVETRKESPEGKRLHKGIPMKKTLARSLALAAMTLPVLATSASAQTTTTTVPASTTATTTTVPAKPAQRVIQSTNPVYQKANRTTEVAANPAAPAGTAWDTISTDSDLSEFAAIVKAAGAEELFTRTNGTWTYIAPSNSAFAVLDQDQLKRLKDPRFKDQAAAIVRHHIANGSTTLNDFTRRLPTGLPAAPPTTVQSCTTTGGTIVNGVQVGGRVTCSSFVITVPVPPAALDSVVMLSGKTVSVQTSVVRDPSGGANRFRVALGGGGLLETTDFAVKNGMIHTTDTMLIPSDLKSLTDIVGRR
jgi:uncharacterized surface protein with fasciclin (FAS1) repeats